MSEAEVTAEIIIYYGNTYKYANRDDKWYLHVRKYCVSARRRCWQWVKVEEGGVPIEVKDVCVLYNLG